MKLGGVGLDGELSGELIDVAIARRVGQLVVEEFAPFSCYGKVEKSITKRVLPLVAAVIQIRWKKTRMEVRNVCQSRGDCLVEEMCYLATAFLGPEYFLRVAVNPGSGAGSERPRKLISDKV